MWFGVLGPLSIQGAARRLGGPMQRQLLGLLLAQANRVVSAEALADWLWGTLAGSSSHRLHVHIHRVRNALDDPARLVTYSDGYLLRVRPGELDLHTFESLAREGQAALAIGERRHGATLLRKALELWRGDPFTGLGDAAIFRDTAMRLSELRLTMLERLHTVELVLGAHATTVAELRELVRQHPLHEALWALLMTALYQTGRRAEALAAYHEVAEHLAQELGIDPHRQLQALHQAILKDDSTPESHAELRCKMIGVKPPPGEQLIVST